ETKSKERDITNPTNIISFSYSGFVIKKIDLVHLEKNLKLKCYWRNSCVILWFWSIQLQEEGLSSGDRRDISRSLGDEEQKTLYAKLGDILLTQTAWDVLRMLVKVEEASVQPHEDT
ncbi:unnamed protein product, partial [Brassica rapa subsp. narinosa]